MIPLQHCKQHTPDLHSNMERFKVSFSESKITSQVNLHSNMERFKEPDLPPTIFATADLHSNMERFKAMIKHSGSIDVKRFTFQYGEI